jgi:DNA-binding MarR family transcriptional regulator
MRQAPDPRVLERFHHLAIRMLRTLRAVDEAHGFAGPRASALAVLVFRGPLSLGELAAAEGVRPPTMSRLVKAMQAEGLVESEPAPGDERRIRIAATARGRKLMLQGRKHRLDALARLLAGASAAEGAALASVCGMLERSLQGKDER